MATTQQPTTATSIVDEFARLSDDEQYERMDNAASFADIPREQCPWEEVRLALKMRALAGHDCYAYTHGPFPDGRVEWVIWDRQPDPAADARFTPREWAIRNGYAVDDDSEPTDGKEAR